MDILKALSDDNRLRIINLLTKYELCVCEISTVLLMSQSNVSRHLTKLRDLKVIVFSKSAQWIHYKLSEGFIKENNFLIDYLKDVFSKNDLFITDSKRCDIYKNSNYSCKDITKDQNMVVDYINNKINGE